MKKCLPRNGVGVLRDGQRLAADAEDESSDLHQRKVVKKTSQREDDLT